MENEHNTPNPQNQQEPTGQAENQQEHYTPLAGDETGSESRPEGKSDLQQNEQQDVDDLSGDLSGNASGNTDAEDQ
ncbi:hypothetical protein [Pedobacter deserti]|uniref:hypothetical protein n=1 Tax=Pedobacter deserti TaxID=2817382 RepID=UPI00210A182A|nr:hypothetical protein [Pedobacter sp. SYSU D00382]